jgi:hypothetical protein
MAALAQQRRAAAERGPVQAVVVVLARSVLAVLAAWVAALPLVMAELVTAATRLANHQFSYLLTTKKVVAVALAAHTPTQVCAVAFQVVAVAVMGGQEQAAAQVLVDKSATLTRS